MWGEVAREIGCGVLGGIRCRVRLGGPNRIPKISARSPAVVFWWRHVRLFRSMALVMSGLGPEARSPPEPGPKSPGPARPECWAYMGLGPGLLK